MLLFLLSASSTVAQLPWDPSASSFLLNHVNTQLFNYFIWSSQKLCKMGSGDSFTCYWCCNWEEIARPCCNCRTRTSFHDKGVERALSQASDSLYAWHARVRSEAGFFWSDLSWPIQLGKQSSTGILRKTAHLSFPCVHQARVIPWRKHGVLPHWRCGLEWVASPLLACFSVKR